VAETEAQTPPPLIQPAWIEVKLKGPRYRAYLVPTICCACGSPAGEKTMTKDNEDGGKYMLQLQFPLCDRCGEIHEHGRPGLFAKREAKEAWKQAKEQWKWVDDAVKFHLRSGFSMEPAGGKATFKFRNAEFAEAFREINEPLDK
jgi:hypothetical protein